MIFFQSVNNGSNQQTNELGMKYLKMETEKSCCEDKRRPLTENVNKKLGKKIRRQN